MKKSILLLGLSFLLLLMTLGSLIFPKQTYAINDTCTTELQSCDNSSDDQNEIKQCYIKVSDYGCRLGVFCGNNCSRDDVIGWMAGSSKWSYQNIPQPFSGECFHCAIDVLMSHGNDGSDRINELRNNLCLYLPQGQANRPCDQSSLDLIKIIEETKPGTPPPPLPTPGQAEDCDSCMKRREAEAKARGETDPKTIQGDQFNMCRDPADTNHANDPDNQKRCVNNPLNDNDPRNPSPPTSIELLKFAKFDPIEGGLGFQQHNGKNDIENYIQDVFVYGGAILAGLAMLKIIFGGIMYATAAGNPQRISEAKSHILYALLGIALIVGANIILWILGAFPNLHA